MRIKAFITGATLAMAAALALPSSAVAQSHGGNGSPWYCFVQDTQGNTITAMFLAVSEGHAREQFFELLARDDGNTSIGSARPVCRPWNQ